MRRGGWVSAATGGFGALVAVHALSWLFFGGAPHLAGLNLTNVASFGATALIIRRTFVPGERRIWLPLAAGMLFYSFGFVVDAALMVSNGHVGTPSDTRYDVPPQQIGARMRCASSCRYSSPIRGLPEKS